MHAYAMFGPYIEIKKDGADVLIDDIDTILLDKIKAVKIENFYKKFLSEPGSIYKYTSVTLERGEALYLYGGRKALLKILPEIAQSSVISHAKGPMVLFRAQIAVASGWKAKQLLVLTDQFNTLPNKFLVDIHFKYTHFTTIDELQTYVNQLKPLKESDDKSKA